MKLNMYRLALLPLLFILTSEVLAATYFVAADGNDQNSGTSQESPWRSLSKVNSFNFSAGDIVAFKRGSSWTGLLTINDSGTEGNPITFTAYGTGANPIIRNQGKWSSSISLHADWVIIENFLLRDSNESGVVIRPGADNNVIQDMELTNLGVGVSIGGQYNLITRNYAHDLVMVVNTPNNGDDDWGAYGVLISAPNNEVSYNRIYRASGPSYDYGTDGSAFELYGNVNNTYVHNNWIEDSSNGFEVGGAAGGATAHNVKIAYNVFVNSGLAGIHVVGKFASDLSNFRVENNTIVDVDRSGTLIWMASAPGPGDFYFRNNIVVAGDLWGVSGVAIERSYNLYRVSESSNFYVQGNNSLRTGEVFADPPDPLFVDLNNGNFRLQNGSPAINRGINVGHTIDYDGSALADADGNVDAGAFEFSAISPTSPLSPPNYLTLD